MPIQKELKKAKTAVKHYEVLYGRIKPPYKILIDSHAIATILKKKIPLKSHLETLLKNAPYTICVTEDTISHARTLTKEASKFCRDECRRVKSFKKTKDQTDNPNWEEFSKQSILNALSTHKEHYFALIEDAGLRLKIRQQFPGIPTLRIERTAIHFDKIAKNAMEKMKNKTNDSIKKASKLSSWEEEMLEKLKQGESVAVAKSNETVPEETEAGDADEGDASIGEEEGEEDVQDQDLEETNLEAEDSIDDDDDDENVVEQNDDDVEEQEPSVSENLLKRKIQQISDLQSKKRKLK